MSLSHPILKKIAAACDKHITDETMSLTNGMQKSFEDVKASVASIAAYRNVVAICEHIQQQEQ